MSRNATAPLSAYTAGAATARRAGPPPPSRSSLSGRRLAAHAALAASALPLVKWPIVVAWLVLAIATTLPNVRGRLSNRLGPAGRLLPADGTYALPALLGGLAAASGGPWGLLAGLFVGAALAVYALGQGHLGAALRWIARPFRERDPANDDEAPAERPKTRTPGKGSGETMRTLLADLLDLSRLDQGRLEIREAAFDLRALIAATVREWRPEARRKGLDFTLSGAGKAPRWVRGDPVRIRQILDTLTANALKFTDSGSVGLTVGMEPRADGRVELTLSVLDSGPGMTGDDLAALFEPYDRTGTSERRAGPGLSRYLAQEIARLMGGELSVTSAPGLGAAFSLKLPLALADGGVAEVDTRRGLRVLVVDDHTVYRQAFSLILQTVCREVVCAEDGLEALDRLAAEPFDLVLMDLAMPRLGGVAATRRLRGSSSRGRDVAVIALTAADSDADRAACLAAGMNGFVSKPVDARELLAAIHAVFSGEAVAQAA